MKAQHKKWLTIGGLSVLFHQAGLAAAVTLIQFAAWLDGDILHQTCLYEECPLKYDIVIWLTWVLIPSVSFLTGYLMYCFIKKIWEWLDSREKNAATS